MDDAKYIGMDVHTKPASAASIFYFLFFRIETGRWVYPRQMARMIK